MSALPQEVVAAMAVLAAYANSPEFLALSSGVPWGDFLTPMRDFSALAGRKNRLGTAFASLQRRQKRMALRAEVAEEVVFDDNVESCCDYYPEEDERDDYSYTSEGPRGCEDCGGNPCRCCDGCYPGCSFCDPNFNPADPWGDGAPEEHWVDDY